MTALTFIIGLFVGAAIGVFAMALASIAGKAPSPHERDEYEWRDGSSDED
jgi:hypothetical protein